MKRQKRNTRLIFFVIFSFLAISLVLWQWHVTSAEIKKTELHLEFAGKRLNEAEQIIEQDGTETQMDNLFLNYQNELNESQKIFLLE